MLRTVSRGVCSLAAIQPAFVVKPFLTKGGKAVSLGGRGPSAIDAALRRIYVRPHDLPSLDGYQRTFNNPYSDTFGFRRSIVPQPNFKIDHKILPLPLITLVPDEEKFLMPTSFAKVMFDDFVRLGTHEVIDGHLHMIKGTYHSQIAAIMDRHMWSYASILVRGGHVDRPTAGYLNLLSDPGLAMQWAGRLDTSVKFDHFDPNSTYVTITLVTEPLK